MARRQGLLEKVNRLKEDLRRNETLKKHTERLEKRPFHDARGRFNTREQEKQNREYAVILRAHVDQEDFRIFRSALRLVGDEVSEWTSKVNAGIGMISDAFTTYAGLGISGVNREVRAINFANRLGLTLPQGRAWSRTFETMGITSFDQLAEVYRNPLELERLIKLQSQNEETAERREDPTIKKGVSDFNDFRIALELTKERVKDLGEEIVFANSGLAKWAANLLGDWKPVVDPNSNWQTIKNVVSSTKNAIDKNTFEGGTLALAGIGAYGGKAVTKIASPTLKIASEILSKSTATGSSALATASSKLALAGRVLGPVGNALFGLSLLQNAYSRLSEDTKQGKIRLTQEEYDEAKERGRVNIFKGLEKLFFQTINDVALGGEYYKKFENVHPLDGLKNLPAEVEPKKDIFSGLPKLEQDQEGDLFGDLPPSEKRGSLEALINFFKTGDKEFNVPTSPVEKVSQAPTTQKANTNTVNTKNENQNITFNVGDIIVNVPAGSDGVRVGRQVVSSIRESVEELGSLSSSQIASRVGRVS